MALRTSEAPSEKDIDPRYVEQGLQDIEDYNKAAAQISDTANQLADDDDPNNPASSLYDDKLDAANPAAKKLQDAEQAAADDYDEDSFGKPKSGNITDSHGDTYPANYNAGDINDLENNADGPPEQEEEERPRKKKKVKDSLLKRAVMRGGPGGTILGLIFAGSIGSATLFAPMTLLANLSTLLGNHTDIGHHLYGKTSKSFVKLIFDGRNCAESTIKCKFRTISESRLQEWEKRGVKVTSTKNVFGRYKVRALEFPNGRQVTTLRQFSQLRYTDPYSYSLLKRWPVRATYLDTKASIKKALGKFGRSLTDRIVSSKKEDKKERVAENNKAMDAKTEAATGDKNARLAKFKEKYKKYSAKFDKLSGKLTSADKVAAGAGTAAVPVVAACIGYNIIRAAEATTVLLWHEELIKFAMPFLIAGAQAQQAGVNGGLDWQTAEMFGDRLTTGVTEKDVEKNPDLYSKEMIGKSAMDAKGISAALNGDTSNIGEGSYASKYSGWAPIQHVYGIGLVRKAQELLGTDNIRVGCKVAGYVVWVGLVQCLSPAIVKCLAGAVLTAAVLEFWGDDIVEAVAKLVQGPALEAMADAGLNSSLHGPPLGQALTSAAGVLASYTDRSSYFAAAGTPDQAFAMQYDMEHDDDYINSQIADAKENQFDTNNDYSFISQFASKLGVADWNGSILSTLANIPNIISGGLSSLVTVKAEKAGLYQPIEIFHTRAQFDKTLENCTSPGLNDILIPCLGESGRPSPYIMPDVNDCLLREAIDNNTYCVDEAIDYLSKRLYGKGQDRKPYIDEKTGKPSEWERYKPDGEKFDNPILMFMRYCGDDREYPLGYTDAAAEEDFDDWAIGERCAPSKDNNKQWDKDLGWMAYYLQECIALLANSEGQDYCWDKEKIKTPPASCGVGSTPTDGDFASSSGANGHRIILVHTTEGDSLQGMADALRSKGYSYHIAIDTDGSVHRLVSDDQRAIGAGGANNDSLQVVVVGHANEGQLVDANSVQLKTLSECIADWSSAYDIPVEHVTGPGIENGGSSRGVAGHIDVKDPASGGHTDPGEKFPWSEVLANAK